MSFFVSISPIVALFSVFCNFFTIGFGDGFSVGFVQGLTILDLLVISLFIVGDFFVGVAFSPFGSVTS